MVDAMRKRFEEQLENLNKELITMGILCEDAIVAVVAYLNGLDKKEQIADLEKQIDAKQRAIESLCMKILLQQQPVAGDLRVISSALKMISDMERIGDQACDISEMVCYVQQNGIAQKYQIGEMASETIQMVTGSIDAFVRKDLKLAREVIEKDDVVDAHFLRIKQLLITSVKSEDGDAQSLIDLLMVAKYFERIGDHAVNIADSVMYCVGERTENE